MNATTGKLGDILTTGANVTIPTESWGTWTGEVVSMREAGPLAAEGTVFVTIRDEDGNEQEVRTNRNYTGYLNAAATEPEPEAYGTLTEQHGDSLERGMSIRLDGHDWNIDHVFPHLEMQVNLHYSSEPKASRHATKSILQLSTFVRHTGQVQRAYVIDNADTFQVIV